MPAFVILAFLATAFPAVAAPCHGRFPNPIADVCWRCIFPLRIGPLEIAFGQEDSGDVPPLICACPAPPPLFVRIGLGVSFWEPARVAEVVRTPFCSPLLGGLQLAELDLPEGTNVRAGSREQGFYQVHWYTYPLLALAGLLTDIACVASEDFDLAYVTELDPTWADDEVGFLLNPEAVLFGNPAAQAACAADCVAASVGFGIDALFWCAGCQGSLYPLTGSIAHHTGGVDSSLLATQRCAARLHRALAAPDTSTTAALCRAEPQPIMRKGQYKTQMLYPRPYTRAAQPFGRVTIPWAAGREYPVRGEDFAYLIWRRRLCCAF